MAEGYPAAEHRVSAGPEGRYYSFFCGLSHMAVCTVKAEEAESPEEELRLTWENKGREHFNLCRECGRWVANEMYNLEAQCCVKCAPFETPPLFCPYCGRPVAAGGDDYCRSCGKRLWPGEERSDGE